MRKRTEQDRQFSIAHNFLIGKDRVPYPCEDLLDWGRGLEEQIKAGKHQVDVTNLGIFRISTVFLALNHALPIQKPQLFETCIFGEEKTVMMFGKESISRESDVLERYATWDESLDGHQKIVSHYFMGGAITASHLEELKRYEED